MSQEKKGVHIEISDLTKSYGKTTVLKSVNLEIQPGEFVVIVGRSGCGKSTLLRQVAGLETPTRGGVLLDGEPPRKISSTAVRVMFQDSRLLPWRRVLENVTLGLPKEWLDRGEWALEQVGLKERAHEWPSVLSGGQKQRVALARALVSQPRLLLLDEPLGALDALTRAEMQRLIEKLWYEQGFNALLVTHEVEEAIALADRVLLVEKGEVTMDIPINLPRPRKKSLVEFGELEEQVLERIIGRGRELLSVNAVR